MPSFAGLFANSAVSPSPETPGGRDLLKGVRFPQLQYDPSVYSDRRVNEQADVGLYD